MHENAYRSEIVAALSSILAFPVENSADVGTPDIGCLLGWIEIKKAVASSGIVSIDVRPAQRIFMSKWTRHGGHGWYLTRFSRPRTRVATWLMHDGSWGADRLGNVDFHVLYDHALLKNEQMIPSGEALIKAMNESIRLRRT